MIAASAGSQEALIKLEIPTNRGNLAKKCVNLALGPSISLSGWNIFFPKKLQLVGGAVGMHISPFASSLDRLKEPPQIRTRDVIEREMFVNLVFMAEWCWEIPWDEKMHEKCLSVNPRGIWLLWFLSPPASCGWCRAEGPLVPGKFSQTPSSYLKCKYRWKNTNTDEKYKDR